ncbi:amidase [Pontibacillus marinus]|uniref:Amidase n=1 Tax=Pontibacillus marinus BH030004 = DSM 16465 TaxID=1385511 RepID=A0A0A5GC45_9BACI|nr:amidase [Pontibacillus marinus]KGX89574.1 amidase [Pontibacillus marinus BH030004 = DSM 16465]
MKNFENIQEYDALGQKKLLDDRQVTSLELTEYYINQINKKNSELNAVVHTMFDDALSKVKQNGLGEGPLSGLPFLIKDLNPIAGYKATSGSRLLEDFVPGINDETVERFRRAGLNFLGKTNTSEFGFLPTTEPELFGPTRNPWDPRLSAGGSSGGAGAAVASGMIPFAHASDGGGSIRIPASACGLFGFKPSRGQLPYSMYMNHLGVNHAITRSVRDSAALLDALHGEVPGELYPTFQSNGFLNATKEQPGKLRIAVTPDFDGHVSIDDETKKAFQQSVQLIRDLGHEVVEASPQFDFRGVADNFINVWVAGGAVVIKHLGKVNGVQPGPDNLEPLSYNVYQQGSELSALEYEEARVLLQMESKKLLHFHDQYDILLTPVLNKLPAPLGSFKQTSPQAMFKNFTDYCSFTPISNVTGQPSMSMPLYWTDKGLPIGAHFTGRLGEDELLFKLASQIEREKPWFTKYKEV